SGTYVVSMVINAPNDSANSLYFNVDAEPTDPTMIWDVPISATTATNLAAWRGAGTFDNDQFAPKVFTLAAGTHQLIVRGREANCQFSTISIVPFNTATMIPASATVSTTTVSAVKTAAPVTSVSTTAASTTSATTTNTSTADTSKTTSLLSAPWQSLDIGASA